MPQQRTNQLAGLAAGSVLVVIPEFKVPELPEKLVRIVPEMREWVRELQDAHDIFHMRLGQAVGQAIRKAKGP